MRRRCAICASPAAAKSRSRWSRPTTRSRGSSTPPARRRPSTPQTLELDLATVEPSVAGPKRPQDRVLLKDAASSFQQQLPSLLAPTAKPLGSRTAVAWERDDGNRRRLCVEDSEGPSTPALAPRTPRVRHDHRGHKHGESPFQRRSRQVSRSRLGGDCGHHQLHQHVESIGDDRRGDSGEEGRRERPHRSAVGEDFACAGLARGHGLLRRSPACCRISKSCASTWWATAAPRASATPARCPPTFRRASTSMGWSR